MRCHYLTVLEANCGSSSRSLSLCLLWLQNSFLTDWWNHLNNERSQQLQTYHFQLSLLDHLEKLWCCFQYRHYTWKMDLPLKVVSTMFLPVCFVCLKESTFETLHSSDNQILNFQIFLLLIWANVYSFANTYLIYVACFKSFIFQ